MGRVHDIVVENFKSYEGRVQIGPFRKFTCVIGPNGAGKSNLMDAISFVLGVQAKVLRSEKLHDLVYRKEGEDPRTNQRTAMVELRYKHAPSEQCIESNNANQAIEEETIVFRRLILKSGEGRFQVNDEAVSQAEYHQRLEGINILSKVRNFLVFQGDVEATAQRQGKDLTAFFEQISGSEAFRQEYEHLAAEKAKKEDNARFLFTKKRNAINEKKRVAHQKEEAEDYRSLDAQRKNLQREMYLFRLHGVARQFDEASQKRKQAKEDRQRFRVDIEGGKRELEAAERERAQVHLQASQADRAVAGVRAKLEKLNPEKVALSTKLTFTQQRIEDLQRNMAKEDRRTDKYQTQIAALRAEEEKLVAEESQIAENLAKGELRFTKEQRQEFERVKQKTERIHAAIGDSARQLDHQIRAVTAERMKAESDHREATARRDHLQRRLAELNEAEEMASAASAEHTARAKEVAAHVQRLQGSTVDCKQEKEQLQSERQRLLDSIQDAAATERQLEREREMARVCLQLSSAVPGVYGRIVDLGQPSQKRLNVAVNVAIGKFVDAVVVDSSETARRCVMYLKERMLAPMTFMPLDDLRAAPPDPRLHDLVHGQRALRLALNCVSFDEQFSRAFEFLLGDVVIADTMTDGRHFAFNDARSLGVSCKVVTVAGEAIAKNGNLSVNCEAAREGSTRFDLSEIESSKGRLQEVDRRLHSIHSTELSGMSDLAAAQEEVRRAETKASETSARLKWCKEQLAQKGDELRHTIVAVESLGPEADRLTAEEKRLREEQRALDGRLGEAVAGHFAKLSAAMGVDDVRRLQKDWKREQEAAEAKSHDYGRRLRNLRAELAMLSKAVEEQNCRSVTELVPKLQAEMEELREKHTIVLQNTQTLEEELGKLQERARESHATEKSKDQVLHVLRKEAKAKKQQLIEVDKRLSELDSEKHTLEDLRANILRQSVLEDVEVPLLRGGLTALQDLAEAVSQSASGPTQQQQPAATEASAIVVDFGLLPEEKQAASTGPAAKMLEEEYRSEIERLRVEMKRLSPNLKAAEQMHGVVEQVQAASHEADVARRDIEGIDARFESVRRSRKERFMDCFTKVAAEIGEVYRRLTANTAGLHSDGGSAYLDLEDTEDPFNGGIKFTAMPPAKRFRDMHLLSGGEKTLAAMALLFAVHAYQRPPFMVLDEVDAALDANNVQALAAYVEQAAGCQTIVISLKDRFFVRSEALVGVWKNKLQETSAVLTLDLTRYLPNE